MKKLGMVLIAGVMSLGLTGCIDDLFGTSKECYSYSPCNGAPNGNGYSCDNAPTTCWATLTECQASSQCE